MKWYSITNKVDKAEIWIYEMIGKDFWSEDGITSKAFQKEFSEIKANQIDLHINSPGGSVQDGIGIYNLLNQSQATITTYIDGWAASIASIIALAGDNIIMAANGMFMIHSPSGLVMGTSDDMRKTADILDKIRDTMVGTYVSRSVKTEEEIIEMMNQETWLNAKEAKEAGFVDEIAEEMDMAACIKFIPVMEKAKCKHIPRDLLAKREIPSERELERLLRDAGGCSREIAKSILAKGYSEGLREAAPPESPTVKESLRDAEPSKPPGKDRWTELYIKAERQIPSIGG